MDWFELMNKKRTIENSIVRSFVSQNKFNFGLITLLHAKVFIKTNKQMKV